MDSKLLCKEKWKLREIWLQLWNSHQIFYKKKKGQLHQKLKLHQLLVEIWKAQSYFYQWENLLKQMEKQFAPKLMQFLTLRFKKIKKTQLHLFGLLIWKTAQEKSNKADMINQMLPSQCLTKISCWWLKENWMDNKLLCKEKWRLKEIWQQLWNSHQICYKNQNYESVEWLLKLFMVCFIYKNLFKYEKSNCI